MAWWWIGDKLLSEPMLTQFIDIYGDTRGRWVRMGHQDSKCSNGGQGNMPYWMSYHGLSLILAWITNYIHDKVWDEITYPFPNFNGYTIEVWEWISNFIPHFAGHLITYPMLRFNLKLISKRGPRVTSSLNLLLRMTLRFTRPISLTIIPS